MNYSSSTSWKPIGLAGMGGPLKWSSSMTTTRRPSGSSGNSAFTASNVPMPGQPNLTPERAQAFNAQIAQDPTRGARERMMRAQMSASQAATTAAGGALAGGAFGSGRAAQLGAAQMRSQGAAQGALAGDQMAEQDLQRQQMAYLQDAQLQTGTSQFNAGQGNNMMQFGAQHGLDRYGMGLRSQELQMNQQMQQQQMAMEAFRRKYLEDLIAQQQQRGMVPWRPIM